jgi:hypothetical protein
MLRILTALSLVAGTACSDAPSQPILEPCPDENVTLQAESGVTPLFTWDPACGVAFLEVYPAIGGSALWTVYGVTGSASDNPIPSGVRYGKTPVSGNTVAGPEALQAGTEYHVRVGRRLCDQGQLCILHDVGSVAFQP